MEPLSVSSSMMMKLINMINEHVPENKRKDIFDYGRTVYFVVVEDVYNGSECRTYHTALSGTGRVYINSGSFGSSNKNQTIHTECVYVAGAEGCFLFYKQCVLPLDRYGTSEDFFFPDTFFSGCDALTDPPITLKRRYKGAHSVI